MLTETEKATVLQRIDLFGALPDDELLRLAAISQEIAVPAGAQFIRQGDQNRDIYILVAGEAIVTDSEGRVLDHWSAPAIVGELAFFLGQPRSANVRATTPVQALQIDPAHFRRLLVTQPALAYETLRVLAQRIEVRNRQLREDLAERRRIEAENAQLYSAVQAELAERKQSERALHLNEEKILSILEDIGDTYFEADLAGFITYANAAFCTSVQYSKEEVINRHFRNFMRDRQALHQLFNAFNAVYRSGIQEKGVEYYYRAKDGTYGVAAASITLVRNLAGEPIGFRGIMHDVTEHLRVEERLRQAKEAAEQELEIGRQIQAGFLPAELPQPPGWQLAGYFQPAREVAGDFFDVFPLAGKAATALVIADVCGKGVGAALFMALIRSLIRAYAEQYFRGPAGRWRATGDGHAIRDAVQRVVTDVNNYIARTHGQANMFATLFFGVLETATGRLTYVNGGHDPPAILGAGMEMVRLSPTGPAVGMLPDMEFITQQIVLAPGETLLLYTDGVTDARDPSDELFGEERLLALLDSGEGPIPQTLLERIAGALRAHIQEGSQFDDITLLAIRATPAVAAGGPMNEGTARGPARSPSGMVSWPARLENLPALREFVEAACGQAGIDEEITFALTLATDEVCTNIITHGYAGGEPGPIELGVQVAPQQVVVIIRDYGQPFHPDEAAAPDLDAGWEERSIGGLGLFFVHELVDHVSYHSDAETGNQLKLIKRLNPRKDQ